MTALLREVIGDVLRRARTEQGRTLREVSDSARVSLGYLSEVERGQKEASSELLASICDALDVELADLLAQVSTELREADGGRETVRPLTAAEPVADRPAAPVAEPTPVAEPALALVGTAPQSGRTARRRGPVALAA